MSETLEFTTFGGSVKAFTTKRTLGRDRQRLCQMLCVDDAHLIIPHQVHKDEIAVITEETTTVSAETRKDFLEGKDAVITNVPGVCIGVSTADCIPVLLYDEEHMAVAAIHAGWRGTVARIVQKTVRLMTETYGTKPEMTKAAIGPGISLKNFEIGDEVYDAFAKEGFPMDKIARKYAKWHINLPLCNKLQLTDIGVKPENVHIENVCTYDNTDKFFSARVEQKGIEKCGRNFNAIMICDNENENQN